MILNSHAGNDCTVRIALRELHQQFSGDEKPNLWLVMISDWSAASQMLHACMVETSLILHLRPDLVQMNEAKAEVKEFHSDFYSFDFDKPDIIFLDYTFKEVTETGALGHPEQATPEQGRAILQKMIEETCQFVAEFAHW